MTKVVGIEKVEYTSKKSGNLVKGAKVHVMEDVEPAKPEAKNGMVAGSTVYSVFFSGDRGLTVLENDVKQLLGKGVALSYDRYGNAVSMKVV